MKTASQVDKQMHPIKKDAWTWDEREAGSMGVHFCNEQKGWIIKESKPCAPAPAIF
jgi:hypothetical protein